MKGPGDAGSATRSLARVLASPLRDVIECLEATVAGALRPAASLLSLLLAAVLSWIAYVPVHELLHAAGCVLSGGEVRQVAISPLYGGRLLARWLPFVQAGGEYAGRLNDFSTGRSDLTYLATDAAPYLLTIFAGVPLLRRATRRRSALLAGSVVAIALAPFLSITGDYYEMGSIIVTRAAAPFQDPPDPAEPAHGAMKLRSDDLPALIGRAMEGGGAFARDIPGGIAGALGIITLSFTLGLGLALTTYLAGDLFACRIAPLRRPATEALRGA